MAEGSKKKLPTAEEFNLRLENQEKWKEAIQFKERLGEYAFHSLSHLSLDQMDREPGSMEEDYD